MAVAKTFTRKITEKVVKEVPNYVELNLTPEEAEYLMTLVGVKVVGGGTHRVTNDTIYHALNSAGVTPNQSIFHSGYIKVKGAY